jgi:hypothetical protein
VHVGVLTAVASQGPIGCGLVGIQAVRRFPEALRHQLPGRFQARRCFAHTGHQRVRVGQQHKGQAVAVVGAVLHGGAAFVPIELPRKTALRLRMRLLQEGEAVACALQVGDAAETAMCHRIRENEACAADEVARTPVVERAVVLVEVEEAATRIDTARVVERQRVANVAEQEVRGSEIRHGVRMGPLAPLGRGLG